MATIPISDGDPKNTYTATASQVTFPYTFWVKEEDHIAVYVNGTLKTLTTDYAVSAVQQPTGGNIVFNTGLSEDDVVSIVYDPEYERLSEYTGTIRLDALNLELTYMLTLLQSVNRLVGDAVRKSDSETVSFDSALPSLTGNGGRVLALKSDLSGIEYVTVAAGDTVVSNYDDEAFNGDGSTTVFNLSFTPAAQGAVLVWVNGVRQRPATDYTIAGSTLTFTVAPTTGTANIVVLNTAAATTVNVPADASVTTAKIADLAVTSAKLASNAVTTAKITDEAVTKAKIDNDLITSYTDTVITAADEILFSDVTDSNNMKKDTVQGIIDLVTTPYPRGYKYGLTLSNNGIDSDHDIDIAVGSCRDSANGANLDITSALTKQIDASWVTGTNQGGLSSSLTVANSTWYHVFVITVAGVDDIGFDTSITAANLVSDHVATAYRRIGSVLTDGSANIVAFTQNGNDFVWSNPPRDLNASVTTSTTAATLSVPTGVSTRAYINAYQSGAGTLGYVYPTFVDDETPTASNAPLANIEGTDGSQIHVRTDTSAQISIRTNNAGGETVQIATIGWLEDF